jgi:cutinase
MKLTVATLAIISTSLSLPTTGDLAQDASLAKRQYSSSSYNQLTDGTACRPISVCISRVVNQDCADVEWQVIYARGTSQQGNVGDSQAVGPLFFNNLASRVGGTSQLAIQGVTYPANVAGFLAGGDAAGSTTMANLISSVRGHPNTTSYSI